MNNRKVIYFCLFVIFLTSMNLWIGWNMRKLYVFLVCGIISSGIAVLNRKKYLVINKINIALYVSFLACVFFIERKGIGFLGILSWVFSVFPIIFIHNRYKIEFVGFVTKGYAWLVVLSVIARILAECGFPSLGHLHWSGSDGYGLYSTFIFYVKSSFYGIRFNGPFLEPGHLGMMSAFLLFLNKYEWEKKEVVIIAFSIALTLSLAGILLSVLGYIILGVYKGGLAKWKMFISVFFLICMVALGGTVYNGGDNAVNTFILSRLQLNDDGSVSGNNRAYGVIPLYYARMWSDLNLLLYGYDNQTIEWIFTKTNSGGTGFVVWTLIHGLVGVLTAALFYIETCLFSKNKRYALFAFLFVCLVFWQRSYPFWQSWLICFLYGIVREDDLMGVKSREVII